MRRGMPRCPECGSDDVVRIVYGYPSPELREEADRGEVALGGCCVTGEDPTHLCRACDHRWRAARKGGSPRDEA